MSSSLKLVIASFQKTGSAGFSLILPVNVFVGIVERTAPLPSPVRQNQASSGLGGRAIRDARDNRLFAECPASHQHETTDFGPSTDGSIIDALQSHPCTCTYNESSIVARRNMHATSRSSISQAHRSHTRRPPRPWHVIHSDGARLTTA